MRRSQFLVTAACALLLALVPACKPTAEPRTRPLVVASFFPLFDFARTLAGEEFEVVCLVPPGEDPHAMEPSRGTATLVAEADLVLTLGLGLDGWVDRLAEAEGRRKMVTLNQGIPTRKPSPVALAEFGGGEHAGHSHSHGHAHGAEETTWADTDPHIWMDPMIAQELVRRIAAELVSLAPQHEAVVQQRRDALLADLSRLDEEFTAAAAGFVIKDVVTFHSAFSYLFARYDINERAVIQLFPGDEPSAAYLRKLVDLSRSIGVKTVFTEPNVRDSAAQIIAREIGGKVERLDPLERQLLDAPERGYVERQRANLETLRRVLGPQ